jgi:putative addiction module component (TIGR02574 family)
MTATLMEQACALPAAERLRLMDALWVSLVDDGRVPDTTPAQQAELEARLAAHCARPDEVVPWEQLQSDLQARYGWKP